jgi:hypothetical protein
MNERIRELYEQARLQAESIDADIDPKGWMDLYHQKFAESIVKECAQVADAERPSLLGCGYITKTTGMRIKEHFGVES